MKTEHFNQLIQLCLEHHATQLIINPVGKDKQVRLENNVTIVTACSGLIKKLVDNGFITHQTKKGLTVTKI
jgi:hypothetical protein